MVNGVPSSSCWIVAPHRADCGISFVHRAWSSVQQMLEGTAGGLLHSVLESRTRDICQGARLREASRPPTPKSRIAVLVRPPHLDGQQRAASHHLDGSSGEMGRRASNICWTRSLCPIRHLLDARRAASADDEKA